MTDDTIICRCEEVSYGEIKEAIRLGLISPHDLRKYTRAGMGSCQGRTCRHLLFKILRRSGAGNWTADMLPRIRPPVQAVTVQELCLDEEPQGE
jgi:NAD(P)H-nitrite reductase large subunit